MLHRILIDALMQDADLIDPQGKGIFNPMTETSKPFQKITVAYDDSPPARDALSAGIALCKLLGTPLQTITVIEPPPAYTGLVVTVAPERWRKPSKRIESGFTKNSWSLQLPRGGGIPLR
jgi:hypothetical protein